MCGRGPGLQQRLLDRVMTSAYLGCQTRLFSLATDSLILGRCLMSAVGMYVDVGYVGWDREWRVYSIRILRWLGYRRFYIPARKAGRETVPYGWHFFFFPFLLDFFVFRSFISRSLGHQYRTSSFSRLGGAGGDSYSMRSVFFFSFLFLFFCREWSVVC